MTGHEVFMQRCNQIALRGAGMVAPNPMVGCVIVHNGQIIAEGYHQQYGGGHAEVNAIAALSDKALIPECTIYVNLEPCAHHGKTPPCAEMLVKLGARKVVIGAIDPHVKVAGKGVKILRNSDCEVITGILEDDCNEVNKRFFTYHQQKRPYVILKWAETADGFLDTIRKSKDQPALAISGSESKVWSHQLRAKESAILIGTETALKDDPELTVRHVEGQNPLRVILDREERLSHRLRIYSDAQPTLTLTSGRSHQMGNKEWTHVPNWNLGSIMDSLYDCNLLSVMVEGGASLHHSFLRSELWDEAYRIVNPTLEAAAGIEAPKMLLNAVEERWLGSDKLYHYKRTLRK